jgi:hypothetical protein
MKMPMEVAHTYGVPAILEAKAGGLFEPNSSKLDLATNQNPDSNQNPPTGKLRQPKGQ